MNIRNIVLFLSVFALTIVISACGTSEQSAKTASGKPIKTIVLENSVMGAFAGLGEYNKWSRNHEKGDEIFIKSNQTIHYKCNGKTINAENLTHGGGQTLKCPLHSGN